MSRLRRRSSGRLSQRALNTRAVVHFGFVVRAVSVGVSVGRASRAHPNNARLRVVGVLSVVFATEQHVCCGHSVTVMPKSPVILRHGAAPGVNDDPTGTRIATRSIDRVAASQLVNSDDLRPELRRDTRVGRLPRARRNGQATARSRTKHRVRPLVLAHRGKMR